MKWSDLTIGKKIGLGFTLVLVLMLVFGLSNFFGLFSIRDQNTVVLDTSDLIYDFAQREIDHLFWVSRLRDLIDARSPDFDIELDPTKCRLGQWLLSPERAEIEKEIPGLAPIIAELENNHRYLHSSAQKIQGALPNNHLQASSIFTSETQPRLTEIRASLESISDALFVVRTDSSEKITNTIAASILRSHFVLAAAVSLGIILAVVITRSITKPIKLLTNAMLHASSGDLTVVVEYESCDEAGIMVKSFNKMVSGLKEMIAAAKNAALETSSASQTASASVEELSASIEQVATVATEFASSVTAISEHTQKINEQAQETGKVAQLGSNRIESCMESMQMIEEATETTTAAINSLKEASKEIIKVVQVVTEIADQTNLLSLNAAIEAARAGEFGHGFAVVAEEVRKLAEQTKTSLQEVNNLAATLESQMNTAVESISSSRAKVNQGAMVVKETTGSLRNIVERINDIIEQLQIISDRSQDQAASSQEIAAMTEEQSAATHGIAQFAVNLSRVAQNLEDIIKKLSV